LAKTCSEHQFIQHEPTSSVSERDVDFAMHWMNRKYQYSEWRHHNVLLHLCNTYWENTKFTSWQVQYPALYGSDERTINKIQYNTHMDKNIQRVNFKSPIRED